MVRPYHFNSRPSARGDLLENAKKELAKKISIHAPPRGATMTLCARRWTTLRFQFTPLREGRRVRHALTDDVGDISIHAPPRGATSFPEQARLLFHFNSRPSARGDASAITASHTPVNFNSRPSARGDRQAGLGFLRLRISIHAPPRGATWRTVVPKCRAIFQFTPLREGRPARNWNSYARL